MSELSAATAPIDWDKLQPLLDAALDGLRDVDRTVVLLRFLEGRSFAEVGASVGLSENAARMRVERALEKLRARLMSRGCTSTAAALGSAMAAQGAVAAPEAWVAALATKALAGSMTATGAGAAAAAGWGIFAMNKLTVALITGIAAAGLTSAGFSWKNRWTQRENAVLRAENDTLRQLRSTHEASATGPGPTLGDVADRNRLQELNVRMQQYNSDVAKRVESAVKQAKPTLQNRGIAAPMEAIETFAWACYTADAAALGRQIYFDGEARQLAEAQLAKMPAFLRDQYGTPEELYGFFVAADSLVAPPPSDPELLKEIDTVFLQPDRIEMRKKGASRGRHQYQWTPEGWKFVLSAEAVEGLAVNVLRENPMPEPEAVTPEGS